MTDDLEEPGALDTDAVEVRTLTPEDLDWVVLIDREHSGKTRREYYQVKLKEAEHDTSIRVSLAALIDGQPAGFLMGRLYYGEFGLPEATAVLDSIAVSRAFAHKKVGKALLRQLRMNLNALGIEGIQTQVEWNQMDLMSFFHHAGFVPASRICLEMPIAER